ncbi:LysM peptidoglycan-binding domain-containing protein [Streptomyces sp. NPDC047525]|uniref:LysM peptidoglycan-binding domain-containing protein n=1 Tax=Streptomyces sp. NPDC047525 TaxID=3155264 RepID=UPI0033C654EF
MRNRSTVATILRALLALVTLVAILIGVPYALLSIGVLPGHVPGIGEITTALTSPDTGELFLGALTLIGWYGWITFVFSVALEAGAALRHRSAPRIRMLGGSQQLAGALVGGILILLPTGTAFASAPSATAASATSVATASVTAGAHASVQAKAAPSASWDEPVHHVQNGDTLWDIAEQRLGAGMEWQRIVEANAGIRQADGSLVTVDTTDLQPGWTLRLPSDATPGPAADDNGVQTQTEGTTQETTTHTVRPGETLTGIAEDELGDPDDYPMIADANEDVRQSDGRTLTDPDQIYPGWQLKIPAASGSDRSDADSESASPPREQKPAPEGDHGGEQEGSHDQAPSRDGQDSEAGTPDQGKGQDGGQPTDREDTPTEQPSQQDPAPEEPSASTPAEQAPREAPGASDNGDQTVRTAAAAGSILAAAVLAVIATRRVRQQRRRRPKRRIPMPSGATASFEKQLRVASDITGTALADRALRTLASHCRDADRPLPEVEAMRVAARGVELHLAAPSAPVAPFAEVEDNPMVWWCPTRDSALLAEDEVADITPPYPALVSLGETEEGDAVLVNLESVGLLRLVGSVADVRAVMLALAVELASSKLAPATQILLAGAGSDLHHLYPDQIDHHLDLGAATTELRAHDAFQREALADGGHDHLRAARLSDATAGDTWIPRILLATAPASGTAAAELEDLLTSRPRTSVAVVTAAGTDLDLPGAWTLPAQPGTAVELPGLDLSLKLQYLDDSAYDRLVQLLATSSRTDDVPPPAWTGHTKPDHNGPQGPDDTAVEASALTPETSGRSQPPANTPVRTGDLATSLPDYSSLAPSFAQSVADHAGPVEAEGDSALSPAVAGPRPAGAFTLADDNDLSAVPATDGSGFGHQDEQEVSEEAPALETTVGDGGEPIEDFDSMLGEVLGEQDDDSLATYGQDAESGLSAAALGGREADPPETEAHIVPRPSAAISTVLAALSTPPPTPQAPQVQVLGPVALVGTRGRVSSNRRNSLMEIAAHLVLHPALGRQDLDDAIWPGMRITAETRNTAISRLRSWMGQSPHQGVGAPQAAYLPPIKGGIYRFSDHVTSDWDHFRELYQQGMHHDGQDADIALAQALTLVRGRPFADVDPSKYTWAEADIQEMISAIVDVAHELAERRRQMRDYRAAAQAVTKGMLVDSQSELLYRDLFTICHEMGDREGLQRAAHQLARINAEEGIDSSPETVGLLRTLLKGEHTDPNWGSAAS